MEAVLLFGMLLAWVAVIAVAVVPALLSDMRRSLTHTKVAVEAGAYETSRSRR